MPRKPLFEGLVFDQSDQVVETTFVGQEPCYVVDDEGFKRHIPSEIVDLQVLHQIRKFIQGHEEFISEETLKMLGQEDIFSRAMFIEQLRNIDQQFEMILETSIPEEARAYMGLTGFRVIIDHHGDVLEVQQPQRGPGD